MSINKTENLGLNQWVRSDPFRMEDFNEDNAKIDAAVAAKAEQTALNAEIAARKNALDTERDERERADAAEIAARKSALAALTGRVGALEAGKLVWKFDTYEGKGEYGQSHPNRLEFDFKPLVVIISHPSGGNTGGYPWLHGIKNGVTVNGYSVHSVSLTWGDKSVEWYATADLPTQLNEKNVVYRYFALGIEE